MKLYDYVCGKCGERGRVEMADDDPVPPVGTIINHEVCPRDLAAQEAGKITWRVTVGVYRIIGSDGEPERMIEAKAEVVGETFADVIGALNEKLGERWQKVIDSPSIVDTPIIRPAPATIILP